MGFALGRATGCTAYHEGLSTTVTGPELVIGLFPTAPLAYSMPVLGSPLGRLLPAFSFTFLVYLAVMLTYFPAPHCLPLAVLNRAQQRGHFRHT